ncbi:MAG: aminopeptidase P family protein [Gracilimonas sp.]|uniref:M24 family metallopeptidase n=1 Tax=Gracilimonas TaxID=649462 RepID=UPI001B1070E5|nr:Xaa-Pro peptidase family protein [Gracilimonas sp.]MBO6584622.1 aminopeptidase P family protein [Gracilimonas sp.]MBO6616107.1 aminopeptidase P family protein [Gracilimonas sp.]
MPRTLRLAVSINSLFLFSVFFVFSASLQAQSSSWNQSTLKEDRALFSEHFTPAEFAERRDKVYEAIGEESIAILQGAPSPEGYLDFRQNNEFYYLSGIESPDAFLILNGQTREATVYLYNRKERREYGEGKILSFEDAELVTELSGIENVGSYSDLMTDLESLNQSAEITTIYTPHSPYEEVAMTRSMANRHIEDMKANPLDTRLPRHQNFIQEIQEAAPNLEIEDLDSVIDELRKIKSVKELELIRRSTRLQAEVIIESMKSTEPGVKPYELEAVSKYIYWKHNIQDDAYYPLIHVGPDAYMNHYHNSERTAKAGDMILMDYGAYDRYYSSDLGRMWPVNGTFNPVQRELYSFYLKFYEAILYHIKLGLTPQQVMQNALKEIDVILEEHKFSKPLYRNAAEQFVAGYHERAKDPDMRLGHGVGMSVHDVGDYAVPIEPGMVFVIEPQFRVPEERIYIRLEDMIIATEDGVEIYSDFLPRDIESIEKLVREDGLLQKNPISIDN